MKWFAVVIVAIFIALLVASARAEEPSKELIDALIHRETDDWVRKNPGKSPNEAIGDLDLRHHAYGCLQIRQSCVDDYNKANGTKVQPKDCLNNRDLSVKICKWYIDHYAKESRLGHAPTDEDKARIWNGGPNGFKKESTVDYWTYVQAQLK